MLLLLSFICLLANVRGAVHINITQSDELQRVLCHSGELSNGDTIIVLFTNITHNITNISFCLVNTSHSLTIKSATNSHAHIQCLSSVSQPSYPTSGFAFINLRNLALQKISFRGCGAFLKDLDENVLQFINSTTSPVHFLEYHSSLLLFFHIEKLLIKEVNMLSNYGFAVLAINPLNATMESVKVTSGKSFTFHQQTNMSLGNGVLLLFTEENNKTTSQKNVLIENARFDYNFDYINSIKCLSDLYNLGHQQKSVSISVVNAASMTILYTQQSYSANVEILSTTFTQNVGSLSGGMLVLHINSVTNSQTIINNSSFIDNYNPISCHGTALSFSMILYQKHSSDLLNVHPLIISNSIFKFQFDVPGTMADKHITGQISVVIQSPHQKMDLDVIVKLSNVNLSNNVIEITGSCLYATTYSYEDNTPLIVILEDVIACNNSQSGSSTSISKAGVFSLVGIKTLYINGSKSHYYNNSGSVFEVIDTNIKLDGNMLFEENKGDRGAVFKLYGNSIFYLNNGLNATFINNNAHTKGGAIYVQGNIHKTLKQCTFQVLSNPWNISTLNISMIFINNTAGLSGSSIYSTNMYNCYINKTYIVGSVNGKHFYDSIFDFQSSEHGPLNVSTLSDSRCICVNQTCFNVTDVILAYPGQTIHIPMTAKDIVGNYVYSTVSLALARSKGNSGYLPLSPLSSWYISPHDENQVLLESQNCTKVNFTVFKRNSNPKYVNDAVFVVSSPEDTSLLKVKLKLLDCPMGFELNTDTGSTCRCSPVIKKLGMVGDYQPICQIVSKNSYTEFPLATITRPPDTSAWAGLMNITNGTNQTTVFGVAFTCREFCNVNQDYTVFLINGSDVLIADPNDYFANNLPLCPPTKTGPLCSTCTTVNGIKYSTVFGSSKCKQCSNWWLLTLVLYAVVGPLLIYLLFALKLTLTTGTLNGILFYAQAIGINNIRIVSSHSLLFSIYKATHVFLSMLNLNLGFPLCFYNGMTELWKAGLGLLFPLYLLFILIFLIILSRFSMRFSNRMADSSVQVLVTVVHLSFTSMFTGISTIVTPLYIYVNDTSKPLLKVWYRDGTVEYGKGSHLILMILTLVLIVPILLSYMTILLAGRLLMRVAKLREYIRPVYEAIHAPYKHNKEFFFAARLLLLVFIYTLSTFYRTGDVYKGYAITIPVATIYVTIEAFCRPFRKMWLNIFNLYIMWNCLIISGTVWYTFKVNSWNEISIFFITTTSTVFLALVIVVIFHILWVTGKFKKLKPKLHILQMKLTLFFCSKAHNPSQHLTQTSDLEGSFFDTYNECREPLLNPT